MSRSLTLDGARGWRSSTALDLPPRPAPVAPGRILVRGLTREGYPIALRLPPERAAEALADAAAQRQRARDRVRLAGMFDDPAADPTEREALRSRLSGSGWRLGA